MIAVSVAFAGGAALCLIASLPPGLDDPVRGALMTLAFWLSGASVGSALAGRPGRRGR